MRRDNPYGILRLLRWILRVAARKNLIGFVAYSRLDRLLRICQDLS